MFSLQFCSFVTMMVYFGTMSVYAGMHGPMHGDLMECIKELGLDEEKVMEAEKANDIDSIDPCLFACVFKRTGLINSKGMYDVDKALEFNRNGMKNIDFLEKMDNVKKECAIVNEQQVSDGEKGCERGALLFKCHQEHLRQLGLRNKGE